MLLSPQSGNTLLPIWSEAAPWRYQKGGHYLPGRDSRSIFPEISGAVSGEVDWLQITPIEQRSSFPIGKKGAKFSNHT
jgi:hypothetical protein